MFGSLLKFNLKTVFTKTFAAGLVQVATGALLCKLGMLEAGVPLIGTGLTSMGVADSLTALKEKK